MIGSGKTHQYAAQGTTAFYGVICVRSRINLVQSNSCRSQNLIEIEQIRRYLQGDMVLTSNQYMWMERTRDWAGFAAAAGVGAELAEVLDAGPVGILPK